MLEAAAAQKNHEILTALSERLGFRVIDPAVKGSILAAAYMSHDLGRVKILCLMGAIIDSVVMGYLGRISDNVLQLCYDMRNG